MDLSGCMWNLALQSLKALCLHYRNAYGQQPWQVYDLSCFAKPRDQRVM